MVIFHSYVSLPEGNAIELINNHYLMSSKIDLKPSQLMIINIRIVIIVIVVIKLILVLSFY